MQKIVSFFSHPVIKKLDSELGKIFENAPHLPKKVIDVLIKIISYLILISGLLMISSGINNIFGAKDFYNTFKFWQEIPYVYFYIIGLIQILIGIISVAAYQPLKDQKIDGWFVLLGLVVLELLMNIISIIFLGEGIFGLLLGLLIGLYFLYEIKGGYTEISSSKKLKTNNKKVKTTKK